MSAPPIEEPIDVRRLRWWEAPGVALWAAGTIDRYARRRLYPDGTPRPHLRRVRAVFPPAPVRFVVVFFATLVSLVAYQAWVGRSATGVAVLAERVLSRRGRPARFRLVAAAVLGDVALLVIIASATVAGHLLGLGGLLGAAVIIGIVLVWVWLLVAGAREAIRLGSLRHTQAELVAEAPGPVHMATDLVTSAPHVGAALVRALAARADAAGVTVIARTEAGRLVRFYERKGDFTVVAQQRVWWGTAVLLVRAPQPIAVSAAR